MEWFVIVPLAVVATWAAVTFNRLVRLRNQVKEAWAGIDVQLQRRYELVPNLVATVTGYTHHEASVLERVTRLRTGPELPLDQRASEETALSGSLQRLFALAEDYPDLHASKGFAQLHDSLVEIEDHLQYARRYYNGSVRDNNIQVESFPAMLIARLFGFHPAQFFEIELAVQRQSPTVRLDQGHAT